MGVIFIDTPGASKCLFLNNDSKKKKTSSKKDALQEEEKNKEKKRKGDSSNKGFALVVVLSLSSLLLLLLVGLVITVSEEGERSSFFASGEQSRNYVHFALAEVKAKIMDGGEIPYKGGVARASMTACPGLMEVRRYDVLPNRGYHAGRDAFLDKKSFFRNPFAERYEREMPGDWQPANPQWIALYSYKKHAPLCKYLTADISFNEELSYKLKDPNPDYDPESTFNLNTLDNPFRPGRFYLGGVEGKSVGIKYREGERVTQNNVEAHRYQAGESSAQKPVWVQWLPIFKDKRYGAVKPGGESNPIVGRYAYWVDVENTKVNINAVKREWEETALGRVTGKSDAMRGVENGEYFAQSGGGEEKRVLAEKYLLRSYQLFEEVISHDHGVTLYYRTNYGKAKGKDRSKEFYENWIFGWEEESVPPVIVDTSVIDSKAFSGLRPYVKGKNVAWLDSLPGRCAVDCNIASEVKGILDPQVEQADGVRGQIGLKGFERMYGQAFTVYGWEEERDPLGRSKLDINAILREGDALFDRGKGLPQSSHRGTPLQQLLARTEDPRYYAAYYPGAYVSEGKGLSYVEGLSAFAGKGADAEVYGKAMRDQQLVNLIEYGREREEPPYIDAERGIVGAKSMPYVAEIAVRARNGIWGLWKDYDPQNDEFGFPGLHEEELKYRDDFHSEVDYNTYLAQEIYDRLIYAIELKREEKDIVDDDPGTQDPGGSGPNPPGPGANSGNGTGFANANGTGSIFGKSGAAPDSDDDDPNLWDYMNSVLVDVGIALINPDPYATEKNGEWEIALNYSWYDPILNDPHSSLNPEEPWGKSLEGTATSIDLVSRLGYTKLENMGAGFYGANGKEHTLTASTNDDYAYARLLCNTVHTVDHLGYVCGGDGKSHSTLVYFQPKGPGDKTIYLPGVLIDGGMTGRDVSGLLSYANLFAVPHAFQPFRIHGWQIRKKGARENHHQVPLRHPGQQSLPRPWWQMTVDLDGEGPQLPPNVGALSSTHASTYGLQVSKKFKYPDFHSLIHFHRPPEEIIRHVDDPALKEEDLAAPFGLGSGNRASSYWREGRYAERINVGASWFTSQTLLEFGKFAESLRQRLSTQDITIQRKALDPSDPNYTMKITTPDDPQYFYHVEEFLDRQMSSLSLKRGGRHLYLAPAITEILRKIINLTSTGKIAKEKAISDSIRFCMLQVKLLDEAQHHQQVAKEEKRTEEALGDSQDDDFVDGMALVERLICIDPVLGHRTGNPDLHIRREGQSYLGHIHGINGHPWRRGNYVCYHYDKDANSPQAAVLGNYRRPEPDRFLTWHFRDPRRCDGTREHEPQNYANFTRRKIPLYSQTGSVLFDSLLTKGVEEPDLSEEEGLINFIEEDDLNVWPYGPGMSTAHGYNRVVRDHRKVFQKGCFLTHSPRGNWMTSIGEIGMCHSGFLQRTLDLGKPPLASSSEVKQLGAPQYGPPLNMLLDLLTPSNFKDKQGNYAKRNRWSEQQYLAHSPENPRVGTWNINTQIAHDNYLAVSEQKHSSYDSKKAAHPVLLPNVNKRELNSVLVVGGRRILDPYLEPFVHFRRGWEQWLSMIKGDYSEYRNMNKGIWSKVKREHHYGVLTKSFKHRGEVATMTIDLSQSKNQLPYIHFNPQSNKEGNLLILKEKGKIQKRSSEKNTEKILYDAPRYGMFPLYHHISEVGYTDLGKNHVALNAESATTPPQNERWGEEKMVDLEVRGDGVLGGMSQAGFARNAAWVMSGNQMSTSANAFTVHIVTQSLRSKKLERKNQGTGYSKKEKDDDRSSEVMGEYWAQIVVARIPRRDLYGKIVKNKEGAPQNDYRVISSTILEHEL